MPFFFHYVFEFSKRNKELDTFSHLNRNTENEFFSVTDYLFNWLLLGLTSIGYHIMTA